MVFALGYAITLTLQDSIKFCMTVILNLIDLIAPNCDVDNGLKLLVVRTGLMFYKFGASFNQVYSNKT